MPEAYICDYIRTPIGRFGGSLSAVRADDLGAVPLRALLERNAGLDPAAIDEVIYGCANQAGEDNRNIARMSLLLAGLPESVPGTTMNRLCGSGMDALITAARAIKAGEAELVIAGGVESMSNIEHYTTGVRWGTRSGSPVLYDRLDRGRERSQPEHRFGHISGMIETAENLSRKYAISREAADAYAARSQQRAAAAWSEGRMAAQVVPVSVPQKRGEAITVTQDEGIRADTTAESLAKLRPIQRDGTVTAGNAAQQNDAAAACLVVAEDRLAALGLTPDAFLVGWAAAGCEPAEMGIGPVPATARLMRRLGLSVEAMDLIEINEAFACQVLSVLQAWPGVDPERVNVNGSGISLGHPIGATGVRIMTTLLHEMKRRNVRYGLETMCIGGGQGLAAVFERA